jgi:hypothetical protein
MKTTFKTIFIVTLYSLYSDYISAQIILVPVGDDLIIDTIRSAPWYPLTQTCPDRVHATLTDTCHWSKGIANVLSPFSSYHEDENLFFIYAYPIKAGNFIDTIKASYLLRGDLNCYGHIVDNGGCKPPNDTVTIEKFTAYYDNKIKIHYSPYLFFSYDTISGKYNEARVSIEVFNNKEDTAHFNDWRIIWDSSHSVTLSSLEQDSLPVNQISLSGFEHENTLQLIFKTSLTPSVEYRYFNGLVQTHVLFSGIDSICTLPFQLYFAQMRKSKVSNENYFGNKFMVFPNPSIGVITILYSLQRSSSLHLHIFNELGKDIMTVYDGILTEGPHDFSFKLSPGMYYARMETAEGVVTKKIIVE